MADVASTGVAQARQESDVRSESVVLGARHLTKQYRARVAVNDLTLEVRRGEIYGFLGPNGAGKTTTIRMCLGLITPTAGQVEILGRDVARQGKQVLPHVGALIEQPALNRTGAMHPPNYVLTNICSSEYPVYQCERRRCHALQTDDHTVRRPSPRPAWPRSCYTHPVSGAAA